ncbi:hypothetical protein BGZ65_004195 [Modicella reniformis]|uniref:Uncharacterized protein n=1 Tax=Modicella reniformis TaxID=1440133 RepID=A0A9P6IKM6_9FUNG|nr:hypothetical protein BGZ65_004195 [Modicella reniformis]
MGTSQPQQLIAEPWLNADLEKEIKDKCIKEDFDSVLIPGLGEQGGLPKLSYEVDIMIATARLCQSGSTESLKPEYKNLSQPAQLAVLREHLKRYQINALKQKHRREGELAVGSATKVPPSLPKTLGEYTFLLAKSVL